MDAPLLAREGHRYQFSSAKEGGPIVITTTDEPAPENDGARRSAPSASSALMAEHSLANAFDETGMRTVDYDADDIEHRVVPIVRPDPREGQRLNDAHGADAKYVPQSASAKTRLGRRL